MEQGRYKPEPLPKLQFDKKRKRVKYCPCGKGNKDGKFVPYLGYEIKGYCHSCGETFLPELPKKEFWQSLVSDSNTYKERKQETVIKPVSFISVNEFEQSLKSTEQNNFLKFLTNHFGLEVTIELVNRYHIGISRHWSGATVFWQKDIQGNIHTGRIMLYNPVTGKRVKEPYNHITWAHTVLELPEFNLQQCFFGEHLLQDKEKRVAIVESEKTAIIASVYLPKIIWLATGGAGGFNLEKCKVLKGRKVKIYPDLNFSKKWSDRAREISKRFPEIQFSISDLLESKATVSERAQGLDLADYLIRFDYRLFQELEQPKSPKQGFDSPQPVEMVGKPVLEPDEQTSSLSETERGKPENTEPDIAELEHYFKTAALPTTPVKLNSCTTIIDILLFIQSHITIVKANNNKKTFLPYLHRLHELKQYLTINT